MFVIGITGPSGAGKSAVSQYLTSRGVNVIDADAVYHDIITPPSSCLDELVACFGKSIIGDSGNLNRAALSLLVFGEENRNKLEILNRITHKYVVASIRKKIAEFRVLGYSACAIDAPLLIEAGLCDDCDAVVAVLADATLRAERISTRDGISIDAAMLRIRSQKRDEFYASAADIVVYNNGDLEDVEKAITALIDERGVALS